MSTKYSLYGQNYISDTEILFNDMEVNFYSTIWFQSNQRNEQKNLMKAK